MVSAPLKLTVALSDWIGMLRSLKACILAVRLGFAVTLLKARYISDLTWLLAQAQVSDLSDSSSASVSAVARWMPVVLTSTVPLGLHPLHVKEDVLSAAVLEWWCFFSCHLHVESEIRERDVLTR